MGKKGQITLMVAVMLSTFLFFFAFVINTGALVNAKINLQNAADLAAYAGAATQARQLTQMSYLNYEMRRRYKKFLFRYNVLGTLSQPGASQLTPGTPGGRRYIVNDGAGNPTINVGVPSVCLAYDSGRDNFCQLFRTDPITQVNASINDQINVALGQVLKNLEQFRRTNCGYISFMNYATLMIWLFNTDPTLATLDQDLRQTLGGVVANQGLITKMIGVQKTVGVGLGLIPSLVLLKLRIINLWDHYLAAPAMINIDNNRAQSLQSTPEFERVVQAFDSAYHTLSDEIFTRDIILSEFIPPIATVDQGGLNTHKVDFDTYASYFDAVDPAAASSACEHRLTRITLNNVPIGFFKPATPEVSYAVQLRAKARVLFSPLGTLDLTAYSAAKPFGSRIGLGTSGAQGTTADAFTHDATPQIRVTNPNNVLFGSAVGKLPNLPVVIGQISASRGSGFDSNAFQGSLLQQLYLDPNNRLVTSLGFTQVWKVSHIAMIPNPSESGYYNMPEDLGLRANNQDTTDPFVQNFDSLGFMAMWAPLASDATGQSTSAVISQLQTAIDEIFSPQASQGNPNPNPGTGTGFNAPSSQALRQQMIQEMNQYILKLRNGQGEYGDGYNVARIPDTYFLVDQNSYAGINPGQSASTPLPYASLNPNFFINSPDLTRTSWNGVDPEPTDGPGRTGAGAGRSGYSVKFIPINSPSLQSSIPSVNNLSQIKH